MTQSLMRTDTYWAKNPKEIFDILETSEKGLSEEIAKKRYSLFGGNIFHKQEKKSPISIFLKQLTSPLIFILIGAGVVTFILKEWVEVAVIALAVFVNAGLGFYREYHAETTLEKLSSFIKDRSRVFRDGHEQEIDSEMLVVGDVIKLSYGSRIPADARIISSNNLKLDEAILTGESAPVHKGVDNVSLSASVADRSSIVHAGTLIVEGFGTAVIVAISDNTEIGKIAGLVSGTNRAKTPIQKGLSKLAWIIFFCVIIIVIGIFILGVSRGESTLEMLVLSAAVSVGAVPEALPIALTVILSIGAERIAKKKGITRTLIAAETLGSASLIMTDKTGTLTEANMQLVGIYTKDEILKGDTNPKKYDKEDEKLISIALENVDVLIENPNTLLKDWVFKGKPFEVNIVKVARDNGIDISRFRDSDNVSSILIPFNSTHKFSVAFAGEYFSVMGAPDILLSRSNIGLEDYKLIDSWINKASSEGKRLIALCRSFKNVSSIDSVKDLDFVGVLAFFDPVRKEVPEAIKKIESFGTKVVMVTGDLKGTALAVARDIGWDIPDSQVLTGQDLKAFSDDQLLKILPSIKIFARVTPEDKLRIGLLFKSLGEVVAMTGDGVNDAPSLKAMDIGVALGSGSDVAKSAADLVLLDDNFQTISLAIQEGRRILVNIRKTFVYLMSNSLDEVFVVAGSLIVGIPLPLTALQIIWVNLFTGSLPALSFAYDEDFDRKEIGRDKLKNIFTREVNILTFGIGILSSALLFILYFTLVRFEVDISVARSIFFVCFASYILVISFSFRSLTKPLFSYPTFSNKRLNQSIIIAVLILIGTMIFPITRNLFGLAPLPLSWLWLVALWLILNVFLVESAKFLFRKR